MSVKRKILLYYVATIVTAMIIGGFYPLVTAASIMLNFLFLPVVILLWVAVFKINHRHLSSASQPKSLFSSKKMLVVLVYSTLLTVVMTIGAFLNISSFGEAVADILFLPVSIQLLCWFLPLLKRSKKS
jgi:magnesium-transporting ATPase (P-type)